MQILKEVNPSIALEARGDYSPQEYFKTRDGLYVYESFTGRMQGKLGTIAKGAKFAIESLDLVTSATDEQIEKSLGNKNVFDETVACGVIIELVAAQPKGEEGLLLNNGYANLFYTPSCVVDVYWGAGGRAWLVFVWERGDGGWRGGTRVFSPQLTFES